MTKAELARRMAWRFKVIQQAAERSRNIARTCRHFGISRQAFYRWKRRFDAQGAIGLSDRPSIIVITAELLRLAASGTEGLLANTIRDEVSIFTDKEFWSANAAVAGVSLAVANAVQYLAVP